MNNFNINKKTNPNGLKKDEYDAIIVGAGIGGLACGCYLARAGKKVLIVEQHHKAGGYCTSFERKKFTFDATTHYIGGLRENGILRNIYDELELNTKVEMIRIDPSNIVIFPDYKIHIRSNLDETITELQENFKFEAESIEKFFRFIRDSEFTKLYIQLKDRTFKELLDLYFKDQRLKAILGVLLINIGLPPSKASALASAVLYREFVIDGGYYPRGGIQAFSDAFVERFKEWGGEIILGKKVEKIVVKNNNVEGLIIGKDDFVSSKKIISNCDVINTFFQLIGDEYLPDKFTRKINNLEISPSAFIVYLGLNKNYSKILKNRCSWWCSFSNSYNVEKMFSDLNRKDKPYMDDFVFCSFPSSYDLLLAPPNNDVIFLYVPAIMTNDNFWQENKDYVSEELIRKAEKFIPNMVESIVIKEIATPLTMYGYTLNKNGASHGFASTPHQIDRNTMPPTTFINGLYLVGHWVTLGPGHGGISGGISTVAYCGKNIANLIIEG